MIQKETAAVSSAIAIVDKQLHKILVKMRLRAKAAGLNNILV